MSAIDAELHMKKKLVIVLFLVTLVACGPKKDINMPEHLLTEQEMISIMTDVQILESDLNDRKASGKDIGDMPRAYYDQLFVHYDITDSIFSQNLKYYTQHPDILERILDSVVNRLTWELKKENINTDGE